MLGVSVGNIDNGRMTKRAWLLTRRRDFFEEGSGGSNNTET